MLEGGGGGVVLGVTVNQLICKSVWEVMHVLHATVLYCSVSTIYINLPPSLLGSYNYPGTSYNSYLLLSGTVLSSWDWPFDFVELGVVLLHAGPDALDPLPEDHVGLGRAPLPSAQAVLLEISLRCAMHATFKGAQVWDFWSLRFSWFLHHKVSKDSLCEGTFGVKIKKNYRNI